ncbi:MAG: OmpA family protein [Desulfobacterota bacterium]|nr:OmpA family protein [Thermodesulfobacteriota bacterium]
MKTISCCIFLWCITTLIIPSPGTCLSSVSVRSGDMERTISLGMTKHELIAAIGAPDRIKSDGRCFHYDTFDCSVFLDDNMRVERIYMGRDFKGVIHKTTEGTFSPQEVTAHFENREASQRLTYTPSTRIHNKATAELEDMVGSPQQTDNTTFPKEYRGTRRLYELYGNGMVMKYKEVWDREGIAFYYDHEKRHYATVIYPPEKPPQEKECPLEIVSLGMVYFDFDKSEIKPQYHKELRECIDYLNTHPDVFLTIEGHTDAKGTDEYNQRLSERRAQTVYRYFINAGIPANRLMMLGYGEFRPIAPNTTPEGADNPNGRAQNRRVQFQIVKSTAPLRTNTAQPVK